MEKITCPGCGTEFSKPWVAADGSWRCLSCLKTFKVAEPEERGENGASAPSLPAPQSSTSKPLAWGAPPRQTNYGFWQISAWLLLGAIVLTCGYGFYSASVFADFSFFEVWLLQIAIALQAFTLIGSAVLFLLLANLSTAIDRNYVRLLWNLGLWKEEIPPFSGSNLPYILPTAVLGGLIIQASMSDIVEPTNGVPEKMGTMLFYSFYSSPFFQLFLGFAIMCVGFALSEIFRFIYRLKCASLMVRKNPDFLKAARKLKQPNNFAVGLLFHAIIGFFLAQLLAWIPSENRFDPHGDLYSLVKGTLSAGVLVSVYLLTRHWHALLDHWFPVGVYLRETAPPAARPMERRRLQPKSRGGLFNIIAFTAIGCCVLLALSSLFLFPMGKWKYIVAALLVFYTFMLLWMLCIRKNMGYFVFPRANDLGGNNNRWRLTKKIAKTISFMSSACMLLIFAGITFLGFMSPLIFLFTIPAISVFFLLPWFLADVTADCVETADWLMTANEHFDGIRETT
jgi:hypothetical protein